MSKGHGKLGIPQSHPEQPFATPRPLLIRTKRKKKNLTSSSLMLRLKRDKLNSQSPASASKASCGLDRQGGS